MIRNVTKINISDKEPTRITPFLLLQFQHCTFSEEEHIQIFIERYVYSILSLYYSFSKGLCCTHSRVSGLSTLSIHALISKHFIMYSYIY